MKIISAWQLTRYIRSTSTYGMSAHQFCSSTSQRIEKHNALINFISSQIQTIVTHRVELQVGHDRLGDIVLIDYKQGDSLYIDASVVSSLCPSYQKEAELQSGGAIEKRIKEKITRNATVVAENMLNFLPLVVETLDGWNSSGLVLLEELSKRIQNIDSLKLKVHLDV